MWQPLWAPMTIASCGQRGKYSANVCGAILIQTGLRLTAAILGPVVALNPVSQCAVARMATTGNCQSGARVAKICCVHLLRFMAIDGHFANSLRYLLRFCNSL